MYFIAIVWQACQIRPNVSHIVSDVGGSIEALKRVMACHMMHAVEKKWILVFELQPFTIYTKQLKVCSDLSEFVLKTLKYIISKFSYFDNFRKNYSKNHSHFCIFVFSSTKLLCFEKCKRGHFNAA